MYQLLGNLHSVGSEPEAAECQPPDPTGEPRPLTPPTEQPTVLSARQRVALLLLGVALVAGLVVAPVATVVAVMAVLVVFFMASNVMKLVLISKALNHPQQVSVNVGGARIPDGALPVYTILLPVYHEASMLAQLVDGILSLDYPEERLDVKLLLEEDDVETREAASAMDLPACFDVLVIPDVGPRASRAPATTDSSGPPGSTW